MDQHAVVERTLAFPAYLIRRLAVPAVFGAIGALLMSVVTFLVRRTTEPTLPRMSDEWLRMHDQEAGHSDQWRRSGW